RQSRRVARRTSRRLLLRRFDAHLLSRIESTMNYRFERKLLETWTPGQEVQNQEAQPRLEHPRRRRRQEGVQPETAALHSLCHVRRVHQQVKKSLPCSGLSGVLSPRPSVLEMYGQIHRLSEVKGA